MNTGPALGSELQRSGEAKNEDCVKQMMLSQYTITTIQRTI